MWNAATLLCMALLAADSFAAVNGKQVRKDLRHNIFNKRAVAGSVARGGVGTIFNTPHQWGRGPDGFAKRVGTSFGKHIIKQAIQTPVAALHHENLHYQPSGLHGVMPRLEYAVKSTFIVPRTDRPGKTVAIGRISGNMGAGLASQLWMPAAGVGAGIASGGIGLGMDVGIHVAKEFWPRHPKTR